MSVNKGAVTSTCGHIAGRCAMETSDTINELAKAVRTWLNTIFMAKLLDSI